VQLGVCVCAFRECAALSAHAFLFQMAASTLTLSHVLSPSLTFESLFTTLLSDLLNRLDAPDKHLFISGFALLRIKFKHFLELFINAFLQMIRLRFRPFIQVQPICLREPMRQ
jgi:hypothetical protein